MSSLTLVAKLTEFVTKALPRFTPDFFLAANCFQCHGTNGTGGFERITGGEASEVYDYLTQTANTDIMAAHAQGYSAEQLNALIGYLNQIPR
jgi:mono/diheme cytochrome c family protein